MSKLSRIEPKEVCSICGGEYSEDYGGIKGYFGIIPVTFCEWCVPSMIDMVEQITSDEEMYVRKTEH